MFTTASSQLLSGNIILTGSSNGQQADDVGLFDSEHQPIGLASSCLERVLTDFEIVNVVVLGSQRTNFGGCCEDDR